MNNQNQEIQVPSFLKRESVERQAQMLEEQRRQQYETARKNSIRKIRRKKIEMKKRLISTTFIAGTTLLIAMLASNGYQQYKGSVRIADEFFNYTKGYSIRDDSVSGKIVMINGVEVSFDSAMEDIVNDARYGGMTDVEISIGMTKVYNKDFAIKYVGEVSGEDKKNAKYQAYYEGKLEEYTKTSGGMSK